MKTIYGVIGNGKLGRLLQKRPDFVLIDCDITNPASIIESYQPVDVLVNCAGVTSIDECEENKKRATEVNVRGASYVHDVYGKRVLTISSDHVFPGTAFMCDESSLLNPVNHYGWTKVGAEAVSRINGGKILRLSRTVSIEDNDIAKWLQFLYNEDEFSVPSFFYRNYLTRCQAVDGIEYFVRNYDAMTNTVNYGSVETVSMYQLMQKVAYAFGLSSSLMVKNPEYNTNLTPRPMRGGYSTLIAKGLGFPMYRIEQVAEQLARDAHV